jgi:ribosomal protein S18 acetylase RimI-like enzyme
VGYVAAGFRNCEHPVDSASDKAKYLVIYAAGLHSRFHGQEDPAFPGETLAVAVFRVLEGFAKQKDDCKGLYLWVRSNNGRAIAFYEKFGFQRDPGGPMQRDGGSPHLTMRKVI